MNDVRSGMVIAGKYRLESALARGGMGSVWRARHVLLDTPVAIKFIGADVIALPEARRRFEREAKAAALLQSPHVVRIHDYGVEGDLPYLVMELLNGEDFGSTLKRQGRLTPEDTANIVFQVARALRRAAEAGIVHRDLKPTNIFVIRDDDEDLVKVLDFGIAKAPPGLRADDESTRKGAIIGSPRYMSPEQARGSPLVDPRSDLWSLAVIAYRAVTGELPFQSLDMTDLIVKICSEDPIPPSTIDPTLGPEMDAFFSKALERSPDQRYQTAKELAAAFAEAAGQPPPSVSSRSILLRHPSGQLLVPEGVAALGSLSPSRLLASTPPARDESPRPPPGQATDPAPAGGAEGDAPSASCERTRISARPPAPSEDAARPSAPRLTPVPKGTPTPYPSGIDIPSRSARPPRAVLARRLVVGGAIGVLILGAVLALAPRHHPLPSPASAAPPASLPANPPAGAPEVGTSIPAPPGTTTPAPPGSAPGASVTAAGSARPPAASPAKAVEEKDSAAPSAPSARPPIFQPGGVPHMKKKHAILGI